MMKHTQSQTQLWVHHTTLAARGTREHSAEQAATRQAWHPGLCWAVLQLAAQDAALEHSAAQCWPAAL